MSHSRRLRQTIALAGGSLRSRVERFWTHPRLGDLYPEFLFGTYGIISASTPLLDGAADQAELRAETDELSAALVPYLREHAREEAGHDVWLLDDLAVCGIERHRATERIAYPSAAALAGSQHFWIRHAHPVAILGYLALLENPASPEFLERVCDRAGLPREAMSTHLRHARLDVTHVAEFDAMLDELPLLPHHSDILATSAIASVGLLDGFFAEVLEHFDRIADPELAATIFSRPAATHVQPMGAVADPAVV